MGRAPVLEIGHDQGGYFGGSGNQAQGAPQSADLLQDFPWRGGCFASCNVRVTCRLAAAMYPLP